ncbi:DEAD/DEAH box helicase [Xanthocytophaga agilis]|uniref:DEAD-box ATP-dependent RNA helicase RhpA n=1 Tax=Xanthocytophaga agilis TaxID=3048010 RepID=A0AAE3R6G7_9BACT|nr:DEAD/DEAH box helicase [Xanthocytophaga agilis]MDJ1501668.1 DEAD/DEAH box helicase [Xanthocytophaga agilis]
MSFENLNLIEPIRKALQTEGYTKPTPIQAQAIPFILQGKDLLGCAQTGTGKTAAFAIPILQLLANQQEEEKGSRRIKALILTPTRELAIQIGDSFAAYGANTSLKHTVIFGGVSQKSQTDALQRGVDILVATPGRLLDLVNQRLINLQHISIFVLDEADRMLDMGFVHDVKKVLGIIPAKRQSLFFSATMPAAIISLAGSILKNPARVEVTPVSSTAETIQQVVYKVDREKKNDLLVHVLEDPKIETVLVFTRTKHGADKVVRVLTKKGIKAEAIHGNKSQNARQRALTNFKSKEIRVLVATDIAARGIDVDELAYVINFEIPNVPETYVHRIGRTGRAGASGMALSFCDAEEIAYMKDINKLIGKIVPEVKDHPFPMTGFLPASKEKMPISQRSSGNSRNGNVAYVGKSTTGKNTTGKKFFRKKKFA